MVNQSKHQEKLNLLIWFRLARLYHASIRLSNQHLSQWNLTTSQFDLLVQIGTHQPLSQQELAEKLFVTKGNITQSIVKLEKLELVKREQEWRTKILRLTKKGEELFGVVVPKQELFQASQFEGLNKEEQKELLRLLKKVEVHNTKTTFIKE
ncbi:MarR family transcriptional regulator [Alkalihalophilus lindianensis]|uniref:MarR family transcriptional regulator n=1 Tax=Alkalihalophilus lindianensis TaxID=1630542 RepID=A0ABU3XAY1_9BACI|nr:MarR family transcriptional regulator [Alkalihalophilus lindianensis]MDV2685043.1 MarR family transcriptional regulator [Alkalihalophilus lindianensis]